MANRDISSNIPEQDLRALESRVEDLIRACVQLKDDNRILRAEVERLLGERAQLVQNNATVSERVDAMISKLKAMEGGA